MKSQTHCLVSINDSIKIVMKDDCHATMCHRTSAQESFALVHHVKCDLDQDSFFHCSLFVRSVVASTFVELTIGNCGANHGG